MSFSFRNLFSQGDDGEQSPKASPSQHSEAAEAADRQAESLFSNAQDRNEGSFEAMFGAQPDATNQRQEQFLVRDLLSLVPPALATHESVSPSDLAAIAVPADGSRTVKLSQIYAVCPQLFATEITPLNDSIMTLPQNKAPAPSVEANPFSAVQPAAPQPAAAAAAVTAPASAQAENPFWAPDQTPIPAPASIQPQGQPQPAAAQPAEKGSDSPFGFPSPKPEGAPPAADTQNPFGFGQVSSPAKAPEAVANPFSALPQATPAPEPPAAKPAPSPFDPESATPPPAQAAPPAAKEKEENGFGDIFGGAPFGAGSPMATPQAKSEPEPPAAPEKPRSEPTPAASEPIENPFSGMQTGNAGSAMSPPPEAPKGADFSGAASGGFSFPGLTEATKAAPERPPALAQAPAPSPEPVPETPAPIPEAKPQADGKNLNFSVRDLLATAPVHVTGVESSTVPPNIVSKIPRDFIEGTLASSSGPVKVTLGQIIGTLPEDQRGYLTQGNREAVLTLPESEIARQLGGAPAEPEKPAGFDTPFSALAQKETAQPPKAEPEAAAFPVQSPAPASPAPASAEKKPAIDTPWGDLTPLKPTPSPPEEKAPARDMEEAKNAFFNSTAETPRAKAPEQPERPSPFASTGSLDDIPASPIQEKPAKPQVSVSVERRTEEESTAPVSAQPRVSVSTRPATPSEKEPEPQRTAPMISSGATIGSAIPENDDMRDIELRAVFGESGEFDLDRVAKLTITLKGIDACAIASRKDSAHAEKTNAVGFAEVAGTLVDSAREIARLTGMNDAETFTMRTARGVASFFLHEDVLLTVQHAAGEFDPGVREKLVLITRGLTAIVNR